MVRVATFNAGLAVGYLPHVTDRLPHVIAALAALDVDLLYLQEVWLPDHWQQVRAALAPRLPYVVRQEPKPRATGGCTEAQVAALVRCAQQYCAGLRDEALAACVVRHCAAVGLSLPPACLDCIASDTRGSIDEIVGRCVGTLADDDAPHDTLHAYGGSFGTALLARAPLADADELVYLSSINARGAVHATIALPGRRDLPRLHVLATHFSPGGAEQRPQVDELVGWVAAKAPRGAPALLLGDLNTTPGSPLFRTLERAGFREPDTLDRRGTFNHGLGTGDVRDAGWRIDHILVRDLDAHVTSRRILDAPVTLASGVRSTLSDHFGVLADFDARELSDLR